ncbi:MAG: HsdR family type I site-specific deoxyribonuclease [Elusimicrobiales bacterium]|nr:HsdR family type I site-specific deoxyribonuclease [Elusimicrobiales bacterium]
MIENFKEKNIVEDYFVAELEKLGWMYVPPGELMRESFEEPLLLINLDRKIKEINTDLNIGPEEIKQTINELKFKTSGQQGIKDILEFFKFGVPVKHEKERIVQYVQIFDYKKISNNEFIVSRQVQFQNGDNHIKADIVLYVNGIPLVIIECKNPAAISSDWWTAYRQIKKEYEQKIPELFKYVQIGFAVETVAKYFPIVPWQEDVKIYEWKEEKKNSIDATFFMLRPDVLMDILKNFIFFRIEYGSATKVLPRYMQYRTVNKITDRIFDNLQGKTDKNKGLIWHWQGSGKTLTMIFAALKIWNMPEMEKPTIFFVVDRDELQEQLEKEINAIGFSPYIIDSVKKLREVIRHDDYSGRRDIMLTLIHKFRPGEMDDLMKEMDKAENPLSKRRNVVALIDEGHRTQYGLLAGQMEKILKNAFMFAFTGTPISKEKRNTYKEFSYPPEENFLDKYFITESMNDEFTVKIAYQPRLEKDVHLKKEQLDNFRISDFEEIPEDLRIDVETGIRQRLNAINTYLENPTRICKIAQDLKEHFAENVDGKFKAMIVAASRKACVIYKKELDKYFSENISEIVMTFSPEDEKKPDKKIITEYEKELLEKNKGKDIEQIRKETIENFKEKEHPKILIVTDMLLTGFDAPILQTMYLDKPLREHRLLQAIARTNRPFKGIKEAGLIIDYVGILKEFKRAFGMYAKEDIKNVLNDNNDLKNEFVDIIKETLAVFSSLEQKFDRPTIIKAIEILTIDGSKGKLFIEKYKKLRRIFELLGPDEIKIEYFPKYKWLTGIYIYYIKEVVKSSDETQVYIDKYFRKTVEEIYKSTEISKINKTLPQISFNTDYLENLKQKINSKEEKAANIVFTLNKFILVDKAHNPIYITIAEKVQAFIEKWKQKNKDYESIFKEGSQICAEINTLESRQKKLGFGNLEYSILVIMEREIGSKKELIEDVRKISKALEKEMFEGWILHPSARQKIEQEFRSFLRRMKVKYNMAYKKIDDISETFKESMAQYDKNNGND